MKINEPEEASASYNQALVLKPGDLALTRKVGVAICHTLHYKKAITFYQSAIELATNKIDLILDMAKLCIQIKQFDKAEEQLSAHFFWDPVEPEQSAEQLSQKVEAMRQSAKGQLKKQGANFVPCERAKLALENAISFQREFIGIAR